MQRRAFIAIIAAIAVAATVTFVTFGVVHTQQQNAGSANGIAITQQTLDGMATVAARLHSADVNYHPNIASIAREAVEFQEAQRRGIACSPSDAQSQLSRNVQASLSTGGEADVMIAIEATGLAPAGYHLTPEANRTPPTSSIITAYENDPDVIAGMSRACAIARMLATVETGQPTPYSAPRVDATFRAGLYARATVVDAAGKPIDISVPVPTAVP